MAVLKGMSGNVQGRDFEINRDEISIGRSEDNTIVIDDPAVSGRHCSVIRDGDTYLIRDHGSTNGTRLNARAISESPLKPKDIITVGSVEFMFNAEQTGAPETGPVTQAEVEVTPGPTTAPESFESISPFGARKPEDSRGWWYILIALVGLLALVAVIILFFKLVTAV